MLLALPVAPSVVGPTVEVGSVEARTTVVGRPVVAPPEISRTEGTLLGRLWDAFFSTPTLRLFFQCSMKIGTVLPNYFSCH